MDTAFEYNFLAIESQLEFAVVCTDTLMQLILVKLLHVALEHGHKIVLLRVVLSKVSLKKKDKNIDELAHKIFDYQRDFIYQHHGFCPERW